MQAANRQRLRLERALAGRSGRTSGEPTTVTRSSEEGYWARHHFCPGCGVTVWYEIERRPGVISIPVGAFADPDFPAPSVEVYGERRCAWLPELAAVQE